MGDPIRKFTVTAENTFTAYIYRDHRKEYNQVVVGFSPYISKLAHETKNRVSEHIIRYKARKIAIELVAEFTGMSKNDLWTNPQEGVATITVEPKKGLSFD